MTQDFKTQLQELIENAAYNHAKKEAIGAVNKNFIFQDFKQGCEFLMPMIEKLIEQRDTASEDIHHEFGGFYDSSSDDENLLNLLRGE